MADSRGESAARPGDARVRADDTRSRPGDERAHSGQPSSASAKPSFQPGQKVVHPIFGQGTVIESRVVGGDEEVTVAFTAQGIKRLMASYARLEKG